MSAVALPDWLDFLPRLSAATSDGCEAPSPSWLTVASALIIEATLALLPDEPALVFNTHWHSDHVGGNARLANRFGMLIGAK